MWLLDAQTYRLVEYKTPDRRPAYNIMSHKWLKDKDEVTFQNVQDHGGRQSKRGWRKIEQLCKISLQKGIKFIWVGQ